ncbi:hypothetical protein [Prevotella falsenii]
MKKLSNFMWLLAIALTATFTFTACGDDDDKPNGGKNATEVEVNPKKVFVNGMPKEIREFGIRKSF